jgi:hypothetical protein
MAPGGGPGCDWLIAAFSGFLLLPHTFDHPLLGSGFGPVFRSPITHIYTRCSAA